jgi:hypothetical protein
VYHRSDCGGDLHYSDIDFISPAIKVIQGQVLLILNLRGRVL